MNATIPLPIPTQRLLLRDLEPSDLMALLACTSDPAVTQYMYYAPMSLEKTREYLRQLIAASTWSPRTSWHLAVVRSADQTVLGTCDLSVDGHGEGDLGYLLARFAWGQGYASEAARVMVRHGFETLGLQRIYGLCHAAHAHSARVLEKAGLVRESLLRNCATLKDEQWDMLLYSRTRASWRAALCDPHSGRPGS
jgi:RimJ/RimL family protein N-acetyltransferase